MAPFSGETRSTRRQPRPPQRCPSQLPQMKRRHHLTFHHLHLYFPLPLAQLFQLLQSKRRHHLTRQRRAVNLSSDVPDLFACHHCGEIHLGERGKSERQTQSTRGYRSSIPSRQSSHRIDGRYRPSKSAFRSLHSQMTTRTSRKRERRKQTQQDTGTTALGPAEVKLAQDSRAIYWSLVAACNDRRPASSQCMSWLLS